MIVRSSHLRWLKTGLAGLFLLVCLGWGARQLMAAGQYSGAPAASKGSALGIPQSFLIQPKELNDLLQKPGQAAPVMLQVGSHVLFAEAHIAGSEFIGSVNQPAGHDALAKRVAGLPKNSFIVLYCGCCPWERCPNVDAAYEQLQGMGFTNFKVLYLASNFGDDWVAKGYRVERGR